MRTTVLNKPKQKQQIILSVLPHKYDFLMELLRNFDFVQVDEEMYDCDSQEEIRTNLKQAAKDLKLIRDGNLEGRPVEELLNEL